MARTVRTVRNTDQAIDPVKGKRADSSENGCPQLSGLSDAGPALRWYAAWCYGGREIEAERGLREQGFATFLPLERYTVRVNGRGRTAERERALIPEYLFVRLDLGRPWSAVTWTRGVRSVLSNAQGRPLPMRPGEVERLEKAVAALADAGGAVRRACRVARGQDVRVVGGPLALGGMVNGRVAGIRDVGGEFVLDLDVDMLGRSVAVSVPEAAVEPL